jgi:hypothetical protein
VELCTFQNVEVLVVRASRTAARSLNNHSIQISKELGGEIFKESS